MKKILLASLALIGLFAAPSAFADDEYEVKAQIYSIEPNLRLYEVCGTVIGPEKASNMDVELIPDFETRREGHYMTKTNKDGKFCQIIRIIGNRLNIRLPSVGQKFTHSL